MLHWIAGLFLVAHGLVHLAIWLPRPTPGEVPFDAAHSWLFGDMRAVVIVLSALAGFTFVVAGIVLLADASWWTTAAIGASVVSLLLMALTFTPWWLFGIVINIVIVVLASRSP